MEKASRIWVTALAAHLVQGRCECPRRGGGPMPGQAWEWAWGWALAAPWQIAAGFSWCTPFWGGRHCLAAASPSFAVARSAVPVSDTKSLSLKDVP